jgi:hypothetical protein
MSQGRVQTVNADFDTLGTHDVIAPTTVIEDTTAESLLGALQLRFPWLFVDSEVRDLLVLVLNSDSASSNVRLYNHFCYLAETGKGPLILHSRCMMHMVAASLGYIFDCHKIITPSFCATLTFHQGDALRRVRDEAFKLVQNNLKVVFARDPAWDAARPVNEALVQLLTSRHIDPDAPDAARKKRTEAGKDLLKLVPCSWLSGEMVHDCPFGC